MALLDPNTFMSETRKNFQWPTQKPLANKPSLPPIKTKTNNFFVSTNVEPYCHCDGHLYDPELARYKMLAEKEKLLIEELEQNRVTMGQLASEILNHECESMDEKMESIYQTDYIKRGLHLAEYRKLMPAVDSPFGVPTKAQQVGLTHGYRDPCTFRYNAIVRPPIEPTPNVSFDQTPETVIAWFEDRPNRSEYQDTYSKMGLSIIKNQQQYMEPMPSSRRRFAEKCL